MSILSHESDGPWKEALERYFPDFLEFFFPEAHADINWLRGYEFLDKELQRVVRDAELGTRDADKLVKVWRLGGTEAWVLVHIEIQSQVDVELPERIFVYHYRIFDRYRRPVASFGVLADDRAGWRPSHFGYNLWGTDLRLGFKSVKLLDYQHQLQELEVKTNPFAVLTSAHLQAQTTSRHPEARYAGKLQLVKSLYRRGYERHDILELFRFVDWLLALPADLANHFSQELSLFEEDLQMPYITSVERIGLQQGLQEGLQQGESREARRALRETLEDRLVTIPDALVSAIDAIEDVANLRAMRRKVVQAANRDEVNQLVASWNLTG